MIDFTDIKNIIELVAGVLILAALITINYKALKIKYLIFFESLLSVLLVVSFIFQMQYLSLCVFLFYIFYLIVNLFLGMKYWREFLSIHLKYYEKSRKTIKGELLKENDSYLVPICQAVAILSKKKIGALITFEKKDSLDEFIKSGSTLNSPITCELLETIFYPGTRLHDGAVVIRGDKIAAASVYFTPTNRPLTGKYGSRHRAAIGISETTDSITIVVSEETGRISLADNGELEAVTSDVLLQKLSNHLFGKN